ncbi:MAG: serine protease [Prevotellaceae bacterium]|jgi:S1-C subfamily serine protease|nr:serine protease [Prevotellaceae bacterium]
MTTGRKIPTCLTAILGLILGLTLELTLVLTLELTLVLTMGLNPAAAQQNRPYSHESGTYVGETTDNIRYWFLPHTVEVERGRAGDYVRATVVCSESAKSKIASRRRSGLSTKGFAGYSHTMYLNLFDCIKHQSALAGSVHYDKQGKVIESNEFNKISFSRVNPGTIGEDLLNAVCACADKSRERQRPPDAARQHATLSTGTGFALNSAGYIVTCFHVIENAARIEVRGFNGDFATALQAQTVAADKKNDLAILKLTAARPASPLPYSFRSEQSDAGERVFTLGYPLTASMGEEVKLTDGIVSSATGFGGIISMYQISAPTQSGNSGGPLFDSRGNIIGIVSAKHTGAENASYAVKTRYLENLAKKAGIPLSRSNSIASLSLPEQVKKIRNCVYIIMNYEL